MSGGPVLPGYELPKGLTDRQDVRNMQAVLGVKQDGIDPSEKWF